MAIIAPTVRSLAAILELSPATVAAALNGSIRVRQQTARRVREAARKAGYRQNPLLSSMMSGIRRSRVGEFHSALAMIDVNGQERPPYADRFIHMMREAARSRTEALGFKLECFSVDHDNLSPIRLSSILHSRGIRGLLVLPSWSKPDLSRIDWPRFSGVYMDYAIEFPPLHAICPDHFIGMKEILRRICGRGYQRPGLFLHRDRDQRLEERWSGAFLAFQRANRKMGKIPPLLLGHVNRAEFKAWFKRYRPDVVIGHIPEAIDWMGECGAAVPETHGFVLLNQARQDRPCAGLDQLPGVIAERSVDLLVALVQRNDIGIPRHPMITGVPPEWVDGPTLRN